MHEHIRKTLANSVDCALGALPLSLRYGKFYRASRRALKKTEYAGKESLKREQMLRLHGLLKHAVETVPFYRDLHKKAMVDREALPSFPILTKDVVRRDPKAFISKAFPRSRLRLATTGGSSGEPFEFYTTRQERAQEWAFVLNLWSRAGFKAGDWRLVLRGDRIGDGGDSSPWEVRRRTREVVLSSYHLSEKSTPDYFRIARDSGCRFLHCHPSSAYLFAQLLKQHGLSLKLQSVLATSEGVYPFQRELLQEVFGCRVYSFYGQSEHVCLAGQCEKADVYHVQPEYGYTEVLDEKNNEVHEEDAVGDIVATGFLNYAMPFIRYRTGDRAVVSKRKCSCGRNHRVFTRIDGRSYDYVVTRRGQTISTTALVFGQHFQAFARIKRMQLLQEHRGEVVVNIMGHNDFSSADEAEIRDGIDEAAAGDLKVSFVYVDDIPVTVTGKHRFMIQKLDLGLPNHQKPGCSTL